MKPYLLSLFILLFVTSLYSQGKLMLVGGGGEGNESYSWSNTPYQWAVDQSDNKNVAIISFSESSDPEWLPNYFISLGAASAENFIINTVELADDPNTYTTLMEYDVLFFKGGDQSDYYLTYNNTEVESAIIDKFNEGGVIAGTSAGMAIMSNPFYSAESNSIYPDQALEDIFDTKVTLKNDFINLIDGYIADTHFVERGRFPRLIAFMANWYESTNELVGGIGVDDRTAFCINENNIGTAYGTGAVNIYTANSLSHENGKLTEPSINTLQVLHGNSYNLTNNTLSHSYTNNSSPTSFQFTKATVMISGSVSLADNTDLLANINSIGKSSILIVSPEISDIAEDYHQFFTDEGYEVQKIDSSTPNEECGYSDIRNTIRTSDLILLVDNDPSVLDDFFFDNVNGRVLKERLFDDDVTSVFLADDAKITGSKWVTNNTEDMLNSYYGELEFSDGIKLIDGIIITDAYSSESTDYYENNTSAITYALASYALNYGLLINEQSYIQIDDSNGESIITGDGNSSSILITNTSIVVDFADQQVNSSGNVRNIAGFDQMNISFIYNNEISLGSSTNFSSDADLEVIRPVNLRVEDNVLLFDYESDNPDAFIIEKKIDGDDFKVIEEVPGTVRDYIDNDLIENQLVSYRIKAQKGMVESCYSEIVQIRIITSLGNKEDNLAKVYPNPTSTGTIKIESILESEVKLLDMLGKEILTSKINSNDEINVKHLISGSYRLIVTNKVGVTSYQIVIINN